MGDYSILWVGTLTFFAAAAGLCLLGAALGGIKYWSFREAGGQ